MASQPGAGLPGVWSVYLATDDAAKTVDVAVANGGQVHVEPMTVDFYRTVFGWDTHVLSDTAEFRYTTLRQGEGWLAGIMDASAFLPDGVPAHWSVYFGVEDTDAALARIVDLGGSIVTAAEDTPHGRLATAADPTGAQFKLIAPNAAMPARSSANT